MINDTVITSPYLTIKEAMTYLNIKSNKTFNKLVKASLPVINMGNSVRVNKQDIDEFMKEHTVTNTKGK